MGMLRDLAKFEMPKQVALIECDFTIDSGELTPTLKVKRRAVEQNYKALIDRVYAAVDPTAATIEGEPRSNCRRRAPGAPPGDVGTGLALFAAEQAVAGGQLGDAVGER